MRVGFADVLQSKTARMRVGLAVCGLAGCFISFMGSICALGLGEPMWWLFLPVSMLSLLGAVVGLQPVKETGQPLANLLLVSPSKQNLFLENSQSIRNGTATNGV